MTTFATSQPPSAAATQETFVYDDDRRFTYRVWFAPAGNIPEDYSRAGQRDAQVCYVATDRGTPIFWTTPFAYGNDQSRRVAANEAERWLSSRYPGHENPGTYGK